MKLNEKIKKQIDAYFDSVTPEHLFEIATTKYKFIDIGVEFSGNFTSIPAKYLTKNSKEDYPVSENKDSIYTKPMGGGNIMKSPAKTRLDIRTKRQPSDESFGAQSLAPKKRCVSFYGGSTVENEWSTT